MPVKAFVKKVKDLVDEARDVHDIEVGCGVPWGITEEMLRKEFEGYPYIVKYDKHFGDFVVRVLLRRARK